MTEGEGQLSPSMEDTMEIGNPLSPLWPVLASYTAATLPAPGDFPIGYMIVQTDGSAGIYVTNGAAWVHFGEDVILVDAATNTVTNGSK